MAKKISQLTQATEVKSDDVTVIVQDGETKKLPLNMMVTKQDIENKKIAGLTKLDEIEATYENDTYTPTITVKNKSSVKTGEGDEVDYSANVMDGHAKSAILSGNTGYRDIDTGEFLETFEEGRNLELVSVRMPVLKTTGKNLFDKNNIMKDKYINSSGKETSEVGTNRNATDYIQVKPNTSYLLSGVQNSGVTNNNKQFYVAQYDANKEKIVVAALSVSSDYVKITTEAKTKYIRTTIKDDDLDRCQIEQSTQATPHEPYKSNILTVNEDVELRGVGKVRDELDLLTGELVKNFGSLYFDGSENWGFHLTSGTAVVYKLNLPNLNHNFSMNTSLADKIPVTGRAWTGEKGISLLNQYVYLTVEQSIANTRDDLKKWISSIGGINLIYRLPQGTVKTVDLMPSGTHPSTTPYCWKNGHIQLSSSGLLPNLEYSVVTSRAGQINQNATMIVKNDKRIFDLEILLAGGLVNTTYQALTLQNQVETGLSKVSLNSETEPDYLLYHMIMKLIEEKAYKLDDLTEKVSVFYLYEKLSDEQFETIYSALYPFVEDEIVEEPVVEELPEVVEDEVIM